MCTNPITIRQHCITGERSLQLPCGKCCECKRKYQNGWYVRLYEELKNKGKAVFFTLTYNEDTVPFNVDTDTGAMYRTVRKDDVVNWLKRFRTRRARAGKSTDFKYFITSEYGPRTQRPHYHGILFGLDSFEARSLFLEWQRMYGFTSQSSITTDCSGRKSIRYVSKYCSKGVFESPNVKEGFSDQTFHLISKKMGFSYIDRMRSWHLCYDLKISKFIDNQHYNLAYVRQVLNRYYYHMSDVNNPDVPLYRYGLPRYWRQWIYSNIVPFSSTVAFDPKTCKKDRLVPLRSQLQVEMSNLIFQDSCDLRDQRVNELLSSGLFCSEAEALSFVVYEEDCANSQRSHDSRKALAQFYDTSMI